MADLKFVLAVPTSVLGLLALPAQAAVADESPLQPTVEPVTSLETIDASQELVDPSARRARDVTRKYLDDMARRGRLVDGESVDVGVTSDGDVAAWDGDYAFDQVRIVSARDRGTGRDLGVAIGMKTEDEDDGRSYEAATTTPGLGMGGFTNFQNGTRKGGGCGTWTHEVGHQVTSCYEKWKVNEGSSTRDMWVYNRWGTAKARGDGYIHQYSIKELTLRSKPWSGTKSRVANLVDYWPSTPGEVCPGGQASLSIGVGVFSAKMGQHCNHHDTFANANTFELQTTWTGNAPTTIGTDGAIALETWAGETLVMADYFWAKFVDSYADFFATQHVDYDYLFAYDSGW
jgi:hypothetical protein